MRFLHIILFLAVNGRLNPNTLRSKFWRCKFREPELLFDLLTTVYDNKTLE